MSLRAGTILAALGLALASALLLQYRRDLRAEHAALGAARAAADSLAVDARLQAEVDRVRLQLEASRVRVAGPPPEPHLALALTDGRLTLERGDIVLRSASVAADAPIGVHTVLEVTPRGIVLSDSVRVVPAADASGDTARAGLPPRTVRVGRADFAAILPNVRAGQRAFIH